MSSNLTDVQLIVRLRRLGFNPGPITNASTRKYWHDQLRKTKGDPSSVVSQTRRRIEPRSVDETDGVVRRRIQRSSKNRRWDLPNGFIVGGTIFSFGVFLYVAYVLIAESARQKELRAKDIFLRCQGDSDMKKAFCIEDASLARIIGVAVEMGEILSTIAGRYDCELGVNSRSLTLKELKELIQKDTRDSDIEASLLLFLVNPHWQMKLRSSDCSVLNDLESRKEIATLESETPFHPYSCQFFMALERLRRLVFIVIAVPFACLLLIRLAYWYKMRKETNEKLMFTFVNGIIEAVEEQSKRHPRKPYIAQKVLRDKLISPRDRKSMARYWTMAVDWLAENESRLRLGTVRVAGEDVSAWMWIGATVVSQELSDNDEN